MIRVRVVAPFAIEQGPTHLAGSVLELPPELAARLLQGGYVEALVSSPSAAALPERPVTTLGKRGRG